MLWIIIGLIGLWFGTQWVIKAATGIAKKFNLSHSTAGVAILAVGTDLPEMFVSIDASLLHLQGVETSGIITGNAIGSSISQITFILGVAALFLTLRMSRQILQRDAMALVGSVILIFIAGIDGHISQIDGASLIAVYVFYYLTILKSNDQNQDDHSETKDYSGKILAGYSMIGFVILIVSSNMVVDNAMFLTEKWGVAQSFVGIAIIGLGTSLPELAVSIGAAFKRSFKLSVGNIVGSNIFDGLIPIGLGGLISTVEMESKLLYFDLPFLFFASVLVIIFLLTKRGISKIEGLTLIILYLAYLALKLFYFE